MPDFASSDQALLTAFEAAAIPAEAWRHREHVRAAFLFLRRDPLQAALPRFRAAIAALNRQHGVPEAPMRGYHETLTVVWLKLVDAAMRADASSADDSLAFCERHPELLSKHAPLLFYSRERLQSPEAKATYVLPDLPLNWHP